MPSSRPQTAPAAQAEQIVIRDHTTAVQIPGASSQELPTKRLLDVIQAHGVRGFHYDPLPDGVKWRVDYGSATVFISELKPEVRSILWIDRNSPVPYGEGATYKRYRVATPYIILKVPFLNGRLVPACELFYRNDRLRAADKDELFFSNLLNVSPDSHGCKAWLCTQYLEPELKRLAKTCGGRPSMGDVVNAVAAHTFGGGLNLSSEAHEGKSCYQLSLEEKVDDRVTDLDRWQKESEADALFILKVRWKSTGMTVKDIVEKQLRAFGSKRDLTDTSEIVNLLLGEGG